MPHLLEQLKAGLLDDSLPYQHPSFITTIPTGSEKGRFLSVDLGGTNCRICLVDLHGDGIFSIEQQKHAVPQHVRVNERYEPLFDWIASQIGAFLGTVNSEKSHGDSTLALGFTFSFTCTQTSLAAGTLLHWDKGWDIPSALGHDPCAMLQAATDAQQLPVRVAALANDSVGSLLTRAYTSTSATSSTLACIIVGTGTNAAYVERLHSVKRQHGCVNTSWKEGVMAINTEWGCMDDDMRVLPRTRFDDMVDARSTDCGFQMLEKRVSGLYLGALLRLAVLELYQQGGVFEFHIDDESPLYQSDSIDTSLMSKLAINDDNDSEEAKITLLANTLGAVSVSAVDVYIVQAIANAIVTRAARLVGAATAAIVLQSGLLTPAAESAVIEKEQAHVATTAVKDPVPTSAPLASSTGSILRRARNFFSAPFTWCLGRNRSKTKTALLSPSPSPSSSLTPSLTPSPSQSQSSSPLAPPGPVIDIGVTGSVIEHHPTFEKEMRAALRQVQGIGEAGDARIRTGLCQDGSAVGAALMVHAAMMQDAAATGH
ncbi:hypothetical protein SBRCBS47491_008050 [Sporothrix bragantina]|uniref:Phosphotransferase n=1 Tax=Sporothrix bragantina TaxID=671064 RepID=A0ABP0CKQ6_9PEZI